MSKKKKSAADSRPVKPSRNPLIQVPESYCSLLTELTERIRTAQVRPAIVVNSELVRLYWRIGRDILTSQAAEG